MTRTLDWTGKKIGKLIVKAKTDDKNPAGYSIYKCECDCGQEVERSAFSLNQAVKKGNQSSCNKCRSILQSAVAQKVNAAKVAG